MRNRNAKENVAAQIKLTGYSAFSVASPGIPVEIA
jgi:hypothetical protein